LGNVPEGDSLHLAARRLQVLVGQRIAAESPHPRAQAERVAERIDGRTLESVHAHGKNLVLRFEGGIVLRSHLRMSGRWTVRPRGETRAGKPWLVLRGEEVEGVLWNGPVLELHTRAVRRLGPDILADPPELDRRGHEVEHGAVGRRLPDRLPAEEARVEVGGSGDIRDVDQDVVDCHGSDRTPSSCGARSRRPCRR